MATNIAVMPIEGSTALITVGPFTDESGEAVTPSAITWTLMDRRGTIMNGRNAVAVTPAATVKFLLTGSDLAVTGNDVQRVLLITWTYNSTLGTGLIGKELAYFSIRDVVGS